MTSALVRSCCLTTTANRHHPACHNAAHDNAARADERERLRELLAEAREFIRDGHPWGALLMTQRDIIERIDATLGDEPSQEFETRHDP
jgi:hypothetical protein